MKQYLLVPLLLACAGCISIGNPFIHSKPDYARLPVEDMKVVALDIERAIQSGEREPAIAGRGGIVVNTEEIKQAIRTRAARAEILNEFLDSGHAREDRTGLISVLHSKEYKKSANSNRRDRDALLVMSENSNRWAIYQGIREASNLPSGALSAIQAVFHDARVQCMKPGQKYEDEAGALQAKQ